MSLYIEIDQSVSYAHSITNHGGKCDCIHGHTAKIIFRIRNIDGVDDLGMVSDFIPMKKHLKSLIEKEIDHRTLLFCEDERAEKFEKIDPASFNIVPFNPTAENLAKYLYDLVSGNLEANNLKLEKVTFMESESTKAVFSNGNNCQQNRTTPTSGEEIYTEFLSLIKDQYVKNDYKIDIGEENPLQIAMRHLNYTDFIKAEEGMNQLMKVYLGVFDGDGDITKRLYKAVLVSLSVTMINSCPKAMVFGDILSDEDKKMIMKYTRVTPDTDCQQYGNG